MTWLAFRQFRNQAVYVFGALIVLSLLLLWSGLDLRHAYSAANLAGCASNPHCGGTNISAFLDHSRTTQQLLQIGLLLLPGLLGVFWGAPLVARELDSGTFRMVWTQGVSRSRWLLAKVVVVGTAAVVATGLASLVVTWWYSPVDAVKLDRYQAANFEVRNVTPIGYALFAFALGVCAGILLRKTLQAMAATLVGYIGMQALVVSTLRQNFRSPLHATGPIQPPPDSLAARKPSGGVDLTHPGDWVISNRVTNYLGHSVNQIQIRPAGECESRHQCLSDYHQSITYQPANRYWSFQWIEFGLYTALAALLIAASFWLIRRRLS